MTTAELLSYCTIAVISGLALTALSVLIYSAITTIANRINSRLSRKLRRWEGKVS